MNGYLSCSGSQESREPHPVGRCVGQWDAEFLSGSLAFEAGAGVEEVVVDDLGLNEGDETQVAFESTEGPGATLEVGPFTFKGVVVDVFEEGLIDEVAMFLDAEVAESANIAPEPVCEHIGLLHVGRMMVSHGEGVTRRLGIAPRGDVVSEVGIIARDVGEPEPAFLAVAFELGLVGEDSGFSPGFLGNHSELSALLSEKKGRLMTPSGDGVMGDLDPIEFEERLHDPGSRHGLEEREVKGNRDGGGGEFHLVPMEDGLNDPLDDPDILGFEDQVKGLLAGQGDVDFVSASAVSLGAITVAPEAKGVTENLEDSHVGTALGTDHFGILPRPLGPSGNELAPTVRILASIALQVRNGIAPEAMNWTTTAGTLDLVGNRNHDVLLSGFGGVKVEEPYVYHNPLTRKEL